MATKRKSRSSGNDLATTGRWVFLAGLALAVIGGLAFAAPLSGDPSWQQWVVWVVVALGLVGGYLHISKADEHHFVLLTIGLVTIADFVGYFGNIPTVGNYLVSMVGFLTFFMAMASFAIVARNVVDWFRS